MMLGLRRDGQTANLGKLYATRHRHGAFPDLATPCAQTASAEEAGSGIWITRCRYCGTTVYYFPHPEAGVDENGEHYLYAH